VVHLSKAAETQSLLEVEKLSMVFLEFVMRTSDRPLVTISVTSTSTIDAIYAGDFWIRTIAGTRFSANFQDNGKFVRLIEACRSYITCPLPAHCSLGPENIFLSARQCVVVHTAQVAQ